MRRLLQTWRGSLQKFFFKSLQLLKARISMLHYQLIRLNIKFSRNFYKHLLVALLALIFEGN